MQNKEGMESYHDQGRSILHPRVTPQNGRFDRLKDTLALLVMFIGRLPVRISPDCTTALSVGLV